MNKAIILIAVVGLLSTNAIKAQIKNAKTETVKVYGNCGMCKTTIENQAAKKNCIKPIGMKIQRWLLSLMTVNKQTQMLY